jgi:peptide/nickel transport system ATP-binding protein
MLSVQNMSLSFTQYQRGLRKRELRVITDLSLDVNPGEIVAVVGASGSGKSLLAHAILGILPRNASCQGEMSFEGQALTPQRQESLRGRAIALIPQAVTFLDPLKTVGAQARESGSLRVSEAEQRAVFARYGLAPEVDALYPFQLSGGMLRKVLLSTAVLGGARLIIADEPTPGLDAESLTEVLSHLRQLADEGRGIMLITHDLVSACAIADRIAVFYAGTTLEVAPARDFSGRGERLMHPYSRALVKALPQNGFTPTRGSQPMPDKLPRGCLYAPRCPHSTEACAENIPAKVSSGKAWARCVNA